MSVYISYNAGIRNRVFRFCTLIEENDSDGMLVNISDVPLSVVNQTSRQAVCTETFEGTDDLAIWYVSSRMPILSLFF